MVMYKSVSCFYAYFGQVNFVQSLAAKIGFLHLKVHKQKILKK
jgi:hypothetical protein